MDIEQLERAAQQAWPALQDHHCASGVLRFAAGVSRRSNTLVPFAGKQLCPSRVQQQSENFYWARRLPATVRVLDRSRGMACDFSALDSHLQASGYALQAPTQVMCTDLQAVPPAQAANDGLRLQEVRPDSWLQAWYQARGLAPHDWAVRRQILACIPAPIRCLVMSNADGQACSTGMSVRSGALLGLFGVATAPGFQRQGLSQRMLTALLGQGTEEGVRYAYLQVEMSNKAALGLYQKLGFKSVYTYWYRVKTYQNQQGGGYEYSGN